MMVFSKRSLPGLVSTHGPFVGFSLLCPAAGGVGGWLLWVPGIRPVSTHKNTAFFTSASSLFLVKSWTGCWDEEIGVKKKPPFILGSVASIVWDFSFIVNKCLCYTLNAQLWGLFSFRLCFCVCRSKHMGVFPPIISMVCWQQAEKHYLNHKWNW